MAGTCAMVDVLQEEAADQNDAVSSKGIEKGLHFRVLWTDRQYSSGLYRREVLPYKLASLLSSVLCKLSSSLSKILPCCCYAFYIIIVNNQLKVILPPLALLSVIQLLTELERTN